jgi:hypothetical protein
VSTSECGGLTPLDPGNPQIVSVPSDKTPGATCFPPRPTETGTLAVGSGHRGASQSSGHFAFFAPDGSLVATREYPGLDTLIGQETGFVGLAAEGNPFGVYGMYSLAPDGSALSHVGDLAGAGLSAPDPRGGLVVVTPELVESFDARAHLRWSVPIRDITQRLGSDPPSTFHGYALGVDASGRVLLLFEDRGRFTSAAVGGLSFTPDGKRGEIFPVLPSKFFDTWLVVAAALGGGFFVQENSPLGGDWVRFVDPVALSSGPPPVWLGRHGSFSVHSADGGRAHALTPSERGADSPVCMLEVTSSSGTSCGVVYFDSPSQQCDSASEITLGADGTLVQSIRAPLGCTGECTCTWRAWREYLK